MVAESAVCHMECVGGGVCLEAMHYKPPFLLRVIARDYPLLESLCHTPPEGRRRLLEGVRAHLTENYGMEIADWVWMALEAKR